MRVMWLVDGPGGQIGRTTRGVHMRPCRRKLGLNLGRIWVVADEKMDVGPFAAACWVVVSTQTDGTEHRTKWVGAFELPL